MSELLRNPEVMEKAQAEVRQLFNNKGKIDETCLNELTYMKSVIKETLRLHPPLPLLVPRRCRESCVIDGYKIPVGSRVIVNVMSIGRDPDHWTYPERFYPERFESSSIDYKGFDFDLIPFGAGRRMCPGINFGIANVELPLAQLLCHFDWKLPSRIKYQYLDMSEAFGGAVRRKNDLFLVPVPYRPRAS